MRRDKVLNQNGTPLTYSVVELNHPSVFIVAVNTDGKVCLIQNYRYTVDKTMWELPAGHSEGEEPLTAAKRELLEESGLVSDDWTNLGTLYQANGIGNIPFIAFLARNAKSASDKRDADEDITSQRFCTITEIEAMARRKEFIESAHLAALYLAKLHGL